MSKFLIYHLLGLICFIPAIIFRKKIAYIFCPDEILSKNTKHRIFIFFNFSPSIAITITEIIRLREYFQSDPSLAIYENYSLLIGFLSFLILLFISGFITDKILYHTDVKYKMWKILGVIVEKKDNKEERGDFR